MAGILVAEGRPDHGFIEPRDFKRKVHNDDGVAPGQKLCQPFVRLEALLPRPGASKAAPGNKIYPYLLRGVTISEPNHVWACDIGGPQQGA